MLVLAGEERLAQTKIEEQSLSTDVALNNEHQTYANDEEVAEVINPSSPPLALPLQAWALQDENTVHYQQPKFGLSTEAQYLQELGDCRQLLITCHGMEGQTTYYNATKLELERRIQNTLDQIQFLAEQHLAGARYQNAAILYRRASSDLEPRHHKSQMMQIESCDFKLVSLYEELGDSAAVEIAQEQLLMSLEASGAMDDNMIREAEHLGTMYLQFRERVDIMDSRLSRLGAITIIRRAGFVYGQPLSTLLSKAFLRFGDYHGTFLQALIKQDAVQIVRVLLASGLDVDARVIKGRTPLCTAAMYGSTDMANLLLEKGAHIKARCGDVVSVLHYAMIREPEPLVHLLTALIQADAALNKEDYGGTTPLSVAVKYNYHTAARLLLKAGAEIEVRNPWNEEYLLFEAVRRGNTSMTRLLLEEGAKTEVRTSRKNPLCEAVRQGKEHMVRLLLEKGADVEARTDIGQTALYLALIGGPGINRSASA